LLTPSKRNSLIFEIVEYAKWVCICKLSPADIDQAVLYNSLNLLEAEAMAAVIENITPYAVFVDSCDVNPIRYRKSIFGFLNFYKPEKIFSLHHAERVNVTVAGASTLAKVIRDSEISRINKKYGEVGSGYPSDEKTIRFLKSWMSKNDVAPSFVRKSWKTLNRCLINDLHSL
jgi:ribonuclease HII